MKKQIVRTAVAVLAVTLMCTVLIADLSAREKGGQGHGERSWMNDPEILKEAGISEDQVKQYKKIELDTKKMTIPIESDIKLKGIELREQWNKDNIDEAAIKRISAEIHALKGKLNGIKLDSKFKSMKAISKEQWNKLKAIKHKMFKGKSGHKHGEGCEHGGKGKKEGKPKKK